MAIYDTMQFVEPEVGTICMGLGASMGQFLLCAGAPASVMPCPTPAMMHQPSAGCRARRPTLPSRRSRWRTPSACAGAHRAAHRPDLRDDRSRLDRDRWFTAEEAKDYGIIDHVIVKRGEML